MKLEPECVGCLFNQIINAFKNFNVNVSRADLISAQKELMSFLIEQDFDKITAPLVGNFLYGLVSKIVEDPDPYSELKKKYNELALSHYAEIEELIKKAEDPVFEALVVAAIGNTIDFASPHKMDLVNDIKNFSPDNLVVNDYEEFRNYLEYIEELLIIGDNTGEIVFDKLLVSSLQKKYPNLKIVYAVRAKPIINDATMQDAREIGLTDLVEVVESSPIPGVDLSNATEDFKKYFYSKKGIILSKGQGNFECLYGTNTINKPIFYLLKAKCTLMERIFKAFNVKIGDLIFKKKTDDF